MNADFSRVFTERNPFALWVYGTLMRGYGNNVLLTRGNSEFVSPAITESTFVMSEGSFPRVWEPAEYRTRAQVKKHLGHVCGELWAVNAKTMAHCDRLEGHPKWYLRSPLKLLLPGGHSLVAQGYIIQDVPELSDWQVPNKAGFLAWGREPTNDGSEYEIESGADTA